MKIVVVYTSGGREPASGPLIEAALREESPVEISENERLVVRHRNADHPVKVIAEAALAVCTPMAEERVSVAYADTGIKVREVQPDGLPPSDLPEGFPARGKLRRDGRFALAHQLLAASNENLDSVDGVGEATIEDIDEALAEMNAERDPEADAADLAPEVDRGDDSSNPEDEE